MSEDDLHDFLGETQRSQAHVLEETRPVHTLEAAPPQRSRRRSAVLWGGLLGILLFLGLTVHGRINVVLLGIDRTPQGTALGRSDTIILASFVPLKPSVTMLSIPRDLWVSIPGYGENRINTAHFFGEGEQTGKGPDLTLATIEANFGLRMRYYVRLQFEGLVGFVDGLGGVPIELDDPVGKLPAGAQVLDGEQALAFVRDRSASDDFMRIVRGQQFLRAVLRRLAQPTAWPRLPAALVALGRLVDTNLPGWQWPRLLLALLRVGPNGLEAHTIDRSMASGFVTESGAQVLAPDWARIRSLIDELFGP